MQLLVALLVAGGCTNTTVGNPEAQQQLVGAILNDNLPAMERALAAGADVNAEMALNRPLAWAARSGNIDAAKVLLARGARINAKHGLPQRTPLHEAVLAGHVDMVRFLIEAGADVNQPNKNGRTALYYAANPPPPLSMSPNAELIVAYLKSKGGVQ